MGEKTTDLKKKLSSAGFSQDVIQAAWPTWWSEHAERSPAALNDLKFSMARKLGISTSSLFNEGDAVFTWKGQAKFKGLTAEATEERQALTAFGSSIARLLLMCVKQEDHPSLEKADPFALNTAILASGRPFVRIQDVLALSYSMGIPVVYSRVHPLKAKRMTAMTVRVDQSYAIILARDSMYAPPVSFYIAHELGHIAKRHLQITSAIIDVDLGVATSSDVEEREADDFALSLLTGRKEVNFELSRLPRNSAELADAAQRASEQEGVDPGTIIMCYGHKYDQWALATSALKMIYGEGEPAWTQINALAARQLDFSRLTSDHHEFLAKIMGGEDDV